MQPHAIFFDLDDTLVDNDLSYQLSISRLCKELSQELPGLDAPRLQVTYDEIANTYWRNNPVSSLNRYVEISASFWRDALIACDCDDSVQHASIAARYQAYRRETVTVFPDASEVIDMLCIASIPLALVTNGQHELQVDKLRTIGIESRFHTLAISGDVGVGKPDPAIFHHALDRLGVRPEDAWHIGDSLTMDVGGAKAAGLTAVWLNRNGRQRLDTDPVPDYEIASLSELLPLLGIEAPKETS